METQRARILSYCKEHGSITIRDAFTELNINSPSKRISELRLSGKYDVQAVTETRRNKDGDDVRFKRYFIREVAADGRG